VCSSAGRRRASKHRGRAWKSARELAVERDSWAVTARCGRGYTELLPDLAVWLQRSAPPVAVIAESGGRREDRRAPPPMATLMFWSTTALSSVRTARANPTSLRAR
jgi:hypothetical protein